MALLCWLAWPRYCCLQLYLGAKHRRCEAPIVIVSIIIIIIIYLPWESMEIPRTDWSLFMPIGRMVEANAQQPWSKSHINWPKGGATAADRSCELWTGVSQAPLDLQRCNFAYICLSCWWTNLPQGPITSGYIDFPPFWIFWKTLKILLLLETLTYLHENR